MNNNNKGTQKYGNDELYESPFDTYFFCKIADLLVDPLHCIGLTPNKITTLSLIFSILATRECFLGHKKICVLFYLLNYIFDCIDGKMARKYNMGSLFGMQYDAVSDIIGTLFLIMIIIFKNFQCILMLF